jgi:hypothetical protein
MKEIWKSIPNYEGLYEASNLGRIKSCCRFNLKGALIQEKILKPYILNTGYLMVNLYKNKIMKHCYIHRLIMLAFKGKSTLEVNHINLEKSDNRLDNLEYCTPKENINHAKNLGVYDNNILNCSIPVCAYDKFSGELKYSFDSINKAMNFFKRNKNKRSGYQGISISIKDNRRSAYGYIWRINTKGCIND